jgi:site-specific DNA-methyltransferase (adenine-specific)
MEYSGYKHKFESGKITLYNIDCMELLSQTPDNHYDLSLVDPPYGGGQHFNFRYGVGDKVYENRKPEKQYWDQLFRISKNQIVWGGNYFTKNLFENRCWIVWFKGNPLDSFSDFELAWTSFDEVSKAISLISYGFNHADKRNSGQKTIHPTQKPVALYTWLLENYAKPGQRILDTHLGSGSSAIAAHYFGVDFVGTEIDREYFEAAQRRVKEQTRQMRLF